MRSDHNLGDNPYLGITEDPTEFRLGITPHKYLDAVTVRFARVDENAIAPKVSQEGDVAADLYALEDAVVPAKGRLGIDTGIALELPPGYRASIRSRSGLALYKGIEVGAGLIDCSYRIPIGVLLYNHSDVDVQFKRGERIAQVCIEKFTLPIFEEVDYVKPTGRTPGWGSSGK